MDEITQTRIAARIIAVETVLAAMLGALSRTPDARASILALLDQLPQRAGQMAAPWAGPLKSDLLAAEMEQAAEGLASFLKSHLSS